MKRFEMGKTGSRTFAVRLDDEDAASLEEYMREMRMNMSSAIRSGLVRAGILPSKREAQNAQPQL